MGLYKLIMQGHLVEDCIFSLYPFLLTDVESGLSVGFLQDTFLGNFR